MKTIMTFLLLGLSLNLFAFEPWSVYSKQELTGVVEEVNLGSTPPYSEQKVCVSYIKIEDELVGMVEDIYDCYLGQNFISHIGKKILIMPQEFIYIEDEPLLEALEDAKPNAVFVFSETY